MQNQTSPARDDAATSFSDPITRKISVFLREIGLEVRAGAVNGPSVTDGVDIENSVLIVDETKLARPGDLLHEAGHLAVAPPDRRAAFNHDVGNDPAEEMMAIAWSYAAALHLGIDPAIVFHENGYNCGSDVILEYFGQGRYFGVPVLAYLGMTHSGDHPIPDDAKPFPAMIKWLRDA